MEPDVAKKPTVRGNMVGEQESTEEPEVVPKPKPWSRET